MLSENLILGLVCASLVSIFGMTALKMWYSLRITTKSHNQIKVLQSQVRGNANKIQALLGQTQFNINAADKTLQTADLQSMSLDDVAKMLGIDEKELNNPLIRPLAEKVFNRLKAGEVENVGQEEEGY